MKLQYILILTLVSIAITLASEKHAQPEPIVKTLQGSLEGLVLSSRNGKPYYAFRGVPYGKYPGRFEVAKEHATWSGILKATNFGSKCAQIDLFDAEPKALGEEDCLFMNIYTPTLNTEAKLPVLFFIHGGGYMSWTGNDFDGKYFVDENVILVSINYRLGPLGFLSFEDDEISGNIGLKDQLLALKWVNKNIAVFGGDPDKVTIAGYSAGASSTHLHVISHLSKGLFRAAISHSGTALAHWAMQKSPRENALKLASFLECPVPETGSSSTKDTIACLKSQSMENLVEAQLKLRKWLGYPVVIFAPVVEKGGDESFITQTPEQSLQQGNYNQVNWISGFTEEEGALFDPPFIHNQTLTEELEENWEEKAPIMFGYDELLSSEKDKISKKIRDSYFGNFEIGELTWSALRNLFTDSYFSEPCETSVRLQSQHSPVYAYVFRFSGDYSFSHKLYGLEGDQGICHGDDLQYLFPGGSIGGPDYSDEESPLEIVEFSRNFVKLWASFIHEGAPTATWKNQKNWRPNTELPDHSPVSFYEIAIETDIWKEDITSRIKVLKQSFSKLRKPIKRVEKTEL